MGLLRKFRAGNGKKLRKLGWTHFEDERPIEEFVYLVTNGTAIERAYFIYGNHRQDGITRWFRVDDACEDDPKCNPELGSWDEFPWWKTVTQQINP